MALESRADGDPGSGPDSASPGAPVEAPTGDRGLAPVGRAAALAEVVVCSGFPTQIALAYIASLAGYSPYEAEGRLSFDYVATLLLVDTAVLVGLVSWLLNLHGERLREILLGARPIRREALLGVPLTLVVFVLVFAILSVVQSVAPWLHNVAQNPLEQLVRSPRDAIVFGGVAVAAGGLREEIQRAFILHRFDQQLGGAWAGVVLFSLVFGAGHALQGWDAAITTATLGALWGTVYVARRSIVAPVVSHSAFNAAEIVRFLVFGR